MNLKAAREICQQLRLRDLGGIIVIDFIDMWEEKNRKRVFDEMKRELKKDRSKNDITLISQFGLMEMTRQRIKPSLIYTFNETCPTCNGTGLIASMETMITQLERWVKRFRSNTREKKLEITVNPTLYNHLTEGINNWLRRIMLKNGILIKLKLDDNLKVDEFICYSPKQRRIVTDQHRH